jgi:hypothetical protein
MVQFAPEYSYDTSGQKEGQKGRRADQADLLRSERREYEAKVATTAT